MKKIICAVCGIFMSCSVYAVPAVVDYIFDGDTFSARQLYLRALERMAQEFAVLHKMDLDSASDKIEDILGIPKEIDLNAVEEEEEEVPDDE